ncbi:MAG: M15 family metallopeptidase, partial [Clostridia bacterium]
METKLRILILLLACYQMLFTNYTAFPEAIQQDPYLILVRRDHALTRAFQPEVVIPKVPAARAAAARHIALQPEAATALEDMFAQAKQEGHTLYAVSGYRSYAAQANVYRSKVKAVGKKEAEVYVAAPGVSEHQTGLAIDVNGEHTLTEG